MSYAEAIPLFEIKPCSSLYEAKVKKEVIDFDNKCFAQENSLFASSIAKTDSQLRVPTF